MGAILVQIPLFESPPQQRRREIRQDVVRRVDYCRFPRVCAEQRARTGFTRDLSPAGLCLRTERVEPVGSLLRLTVRTLDGLPSREAIGRVAWTRPTLDGVHWMGLELIDAIPGRPLRIRYLRHRPATGRVA